MKDSAYYRHEDLYILVIFIYLNLTYSFIFAIKHKRYLLYYIGQ